LSDPGAEAGTSQLDELLSLRDFEDAARRTLPHMAFEFLASGAADEHTLRWNEEAFTRIRLRPRIPERSDPPDTGTHLLGRRHACPILLAPTAYHRVLHPDGELATARGARDAQVTWVFSTASTASVEEVSTGAGPDLWFQLYVQDDRGFTRGLVERAEAAGCEALCVTVDTPALGARNRQSRAGFSLSPGTPTPHLLQREGEEMAVMTRIRTPVSWADLAWLRSTTRMPILLKGVLGSADANRAMEEGFDGVIVSNHGGRNLDTVPASIDALPEVAAAVAGRGLVLMDGGVRRGTDIVKALALGARAVLVGRPYAYGLSVAGAAGVARVVEILRHELEITMTLLGRSSLAEIDRGILWDPAPKG
jgi:4-hydroxymandelate oxidase